MTPGDKAFLRMTLDLRLFGLRCMPTEELKRLWDLYDGTNEPEGVYGEDIHFELNRRGEGQHCAV